MGASKRSRHTLVAAKSLLTASCLVGALAFPAAASSLPAMPEDSRPVLGIGIGPSVSLDWRAFQPLSLGFSSAVSFWDPSSFGVVRYDVRGIYLLRDGGATNFTLSAIAGIWGDTSFLRQQVEGLPFGLEGGIALSYPFLPHLIGRVNFVAGYQFFSSPLGVNPGFFPPAAGLELAYYPSPGWELTFGFNGQGDIVGVRWHI